MEKKISGQTTPEMPVAHSLPNHAHSCAQQSSQDLDPDDSDSILPEGKSDDLGTSTRAHQTEA